MNDLIFIADNLHWETWQNYTKLHQTTFTFSFTL